MIRVAVLYPASEGKTFNVDYYKNVHMKLVEQQLGSLGLLGCEVDAGVAGMGDAPAPYAAIGYMFFETRQQFEDAMSQAGAPLFEDVPNYTNITPVLQVSDYEKL